jgi:hypothetical protein
MHKNCCKITGADWFVIYEYIRGLPLTWFHRRAAPRGWLDCTVLLIAHRCPLLLVIIDDEEVNLVYLQEIGFNWNNGPCIVVLEKKNRVYHLN